MTNWEIGVSMPRWLVMAVVGCVTLEWGDGFVIQSAQETGNILIFTYQRWFYRKLNNECKASYLWTVDLTTVPRTNVPKITASSSPEKNSLKDYNPLLYRSFAVSWGPSCQSLAFIPRQLEYFLICPIPVSYRCCLHRLLVVSVV